MALVKLVNIEKRWGNVVGVARQSLDIQDGEFMVFLGPSGCGKTTTMRMVAGLEEPSDGQIWIGDKDVTDALPKDRDVAMVFQNYGLYPHMSVADNIGYPLKIRGVGREERQRQVQEVAQKVELEHLLARRPRDLSGGQRQRVALARAIVRRPQVFLMDEPLSNLDAKLRASMRAEIRRLQAEMRITTIYVTHDQIEAMTLADRIVVMKSGVIQQLGTPAEVYARPANLFVAGFVGSPPMNLLSATVQGGVVHVGVQRLDGLTPPATAQGDVVLGVRPEDLRVAAEGSAQDGEALLKGQVYMSELTGDAVLLTVEVGKDRLCVRGDRHLRLAIGDPVALALPAQHCHFFDPKTEARL
ncbi:ABC transporter ATP-binding protein [Hydrogenophaga sp. BPS33]|uniref:ABC transporter ATP-binding protein n=1 Tax=Hydrogenophaga sp. BPS33 TaxID=2651974 RepID=UPI00131FC1F5|nr:ABC transporter ATP-binding protein [Hydrogenophaga sp. BPS33]QHE88589.1 ABC transporter ATP-binding protein [Hydrogenophaga sp. BPS33]